MAIRLTDSSKQILRAYNDWWKHVGQNSIGGNTNYEIWAAAWRSCQLHTPTEDAGKMSEEMAESALQREKDKYMKEYGEAGPRKILKGEIKTMLFPNIELMIQHVEFGRATNIIAARQELEAARRLVEASEELAISIKRWNQAVETIIGRKPESDMGTERIFRALANCRRGAEEK